MARGRRPDPRINRIHPTKIRTRRSAVPRLSRLAVPLSTLPMEAKLVDALPAGGEWQYEPKWDGFRCLAFRAGDKVELRAKSGKALTRYFPEIIAALRALKAAPFVLDGELLVESDGGFSFDALQMRLHPAASRVARLSKETPASYALFDLLLGPDAKSLLDAPLSRRRKALESFFRVSGARGRFNLSPTTLNRNVAERWLSQRGGDLDGVIAKNLNGPYRPGVRDMFKVKRRRTADCVVGGFRYGTNSREVGSLLLGLYDKENKLNHVGFTSNFPDRRRLTRKLERLIAPPGFSGRAPGGPSRWSTERSAEWKPLRPKLVVEVRYDKVTDERFRHGTKFLRWRPDKAPAQCTFDQIQ